MQRPEIQSEWPESPYDYGINKTPHINVACLYQDERDRRASVATAKGLPKANYRPVSLRWWYIGSLIAVLVALVAVVVYSDIKLRGSDSTATVESRTLGHDEAWILYVRGPEELHPRQGGTRPETTPAPEGPRPTEVVGAPGDDDGRQTAAAEGPTLTTALVEVSTTYTSTGPPVTEIFTTSTVSFVSSDVTTTAIDTLPDVVTTIYPTDNPTAPPGQPIVSTITGGTVVETKTIPGGALATVPVTLTTVKPGEEFVKIGKTTVYSTFTVDRQGSKVDGPVTRLITSEVGGMVMTSVETPLPTKQVTIGPDGILTTLTALPRPITHVLSIPPTRTIITALSTPTSSDDTIIVEASQYELTSAKYFIGKFLPPLLAVILALAIRAIDQTAKLYQPFAALSHRLGATGRNSLTLHFDGWKGFWRPFGMVSKGHPVPLLSTLAVWLSTALAPIASEAIGLKIHGRCKINNIGGCALSLGVSSLSARVLAGVLGTIAVLLGWLLVAVSWRWKTGVFADPRCVAGAAALVRNPDIRSIVALDFGAAKAAMTEYRFCLGWFRNHDEHEEYGLVLCDEAGQSLRGARREEGSAMMMETAYAQGAGYRGDRFVGTIRKPPATFVALTLWWRLLFLIYMMLLMGFVIYYHVGIDMPDGLRRFIEGEKFGVRFISSTMGVIIILCWECVFCSIAIVAPYRRMANGPQGPSRSVLAKRPTYSVTGILTGIRERDPLLCGVACMSVLSDFLPMLLANVPYDLTQTQAVHVICSRVSAGLLLLMVVALVSTMFIRWPELPVDPRSVAGEMWYVAESRWVERLEGVAVMTERERRAMFRNMGGKWSCGMVNARLGRRIGVEMHDGASMMESSGLLTRPS